MFLKAWSVAGRISSQRKYGCTLNLVRHWSHKNTADYGADNVLELAVARLPSLRQPNWRLGRLERATGKHQCAGRGRIRLGWG
jgi:hypothetical protein